MTSSAQGLVATGTRLYFTGHGSVAFKEVANVKTTPEIGATPQQIEITNLDDVNQRYAMGMGNVPMLAFTVVYKGPDWNTIYALAGNGEEYDWKLVYPDGMYITFTGPFQIQLEPMDVNTAATYTLTIAPDNIPKFHKSDSDSESEESEGGDSGMSYRPMFVKTFDSVADMNSYDDAADDVIQGDFVLINSTDGDRGKVYFYNGDGFTFFANIIGPQGIKGDKGDPGLDMRMLGKEDALPALANEGSFCFVGTTLYSYTNSKWINLGDFKGDKGDKGDQGIQGEKGETGATGPTGPTGPKGETGDSAYTEAVAGGFKGTQEQWIASLKGDKGDSAYTQAVASGFKGSETDWLASLKGDKGDKGDTGTVDNTGLISAPAFQSLQTQVDNSAVGTNLLTNSNFLSGLDNFVVNTGTNSDCKAVVTTDSDGDTCVHITGTGAYCGLYCKPVSFNQNQVITGSTLVKGTGKCNLVGLPNRPGSNFGTISTESYSKVGTTCQAASSTNSFCAYFDPVNGVLDIYIKFPKLELGSHATDWCPNPSEILTKSDYAKIQAAIVALGGALS